MPTSPTKLNTAASARAAPGVRQRVETALAMALAIDRQRDMLALFPEMGREYDPVYDAARLSVPCRWIAIPDTPFTIYYVIDYDADEVRVFYIEHQRMNPMGRFS